jgi:hypothetical protein
MEARSPKKDHDKYLLDDSNLIEEKSIMSKELEWLLQNEFPLVCEETRKYLEDCMKFIKKSRRGRKAEIEDEEDPVFQLEDSRIISFSNQLKTVSGFIVMEGWNIEEAEIDAKFPKSKKSVSVKTKIQSGKPWRLKQLQSVYEYCKLARQFIEESTASLKDLERIPPTRALQVISGVMDILSSARLILLLPSKNQSAQGSSQQQTVFQPPLPTTILVDFKIKQKMVIITAALVKPVPRPTPDMKARSFYNLRQNQHYEIIEQYNVECATKKLDTIFTFVQDSSMLCEEFKEKLLALIN